MAELGGIAESDGHITIGPLATHADLVRSDAAAEVRAAAGCGGGGDRVAANPGSRDGGRQRHERGRVRGHRAAAHCAGRDGDAAIARRAAGSWRWRTCSSSRTRRKRSRTNCWSPCAFQSLASGAHSAFIKLGRRNALAISRLSVAAVLEIGKDGRIAEARIVPGAAFPTWQRVAEAEQMLIGEKPEAEAVRCRWPEGVRGNDQGHGPPLVHGVQGTGDCGAGEACAGAVCRRAGCRTRPRAPQEVGQSLHPATPTSPTARWGQRALPTK